MHITNTRFNLITNLHIFVTSSCASKINTKKSFVCSNHFNIHETRLPFDKVYEIQLYLFVCLRHILPLFISFQNISEDRSNCYLLPLFNDHFMIDLK